MRGKMDLNGLYTAIVTPFHQDGRFNSLKMKELIRFQALNGVKGIVPAGTTGENSTFSDREFLRVFEITIEASKEVSMQVIAGCGSNNTEKSIILCKKAAELGADAALVITPYYNKPNQEGLFKHFSLIADNSPIPLVLYNVPSRTGVNLLPETVFKLSYHENIIGLKEASGNMSQIQEIIFACEERMNILSGEDDLTHAIMAAGAKGVVSVASNIIPDLMNRLVDAALRGEFAESRTLQKEAHEMCKALFIDSNPVPIKAAMNMIGMEVGPTRMPLTAIDTTKADQLIGVLKKYQLIKDS